MTKIIRATGECTDGSCKERQRCEVWTRVMGYHRPVAYFNIGKKSEHYSRKHFEECGAANSAFVTAYGEAAAVC